jgi:DNA-binding CsgD family transcriptional regulator
MARPKATVPDEPLPSEDYITLFDGQGASPSRGYMLAMTMDGTHRKVWHGVAKYGSWAAALAAARQAREIWLATRDPQDAVPGRGKRAHTRGCRYDAVRRQWVARWTDPIVRRLYSVGCGDGEAGRERAHALRAEAESRIASHRPTMDLVPPRGRAPAIRRQTKEALTERLADLQRKIWALKSEQHRVRLSLRALEGDDGPAPAMPQHESRTLRAEVARMSRAGYSVRDIASHLGITERAVYSHRHKAGVATPRAETPGEPQPPDGG